MGRACLVLGGWDQSDLPVEASVVLGVAAAANSAGYYSATATSSSSDGYNTLSRTNTCGVTVEAKPWTSGGAKPGTPSATCAAYKSHGTVVDLLRAAYTTAGANLGAPVVGSWSSADYGSLVAGPDASGNISCAFYRSHYAYDEDGVADGDYLLSVLWTKNGSGAV